MDEIRQARCIEMAPRNECGWTFAVDTDRRGRLFFATAEEALRFARFDVYLPPSRVDDCLAQLRQGHAIGWAYGFAQIQIRALDQYGNPAAGPCVSCGRSTTNRDAFLGRPIFRCASADCMVY